MKIAPLLAQYLYNNGKLPLPGIGTFLLESPAVQTAIDSKAKPVLLEGVSFHQDKLTKEEPDLIAFISEQAGKIKPLASADLESHLELAKQFLNIGKPYLFEGIGTLSKKGNEYTFTSGTIIAEPVREHNIREAVAQQAGDDHSGYDKVFYSKNKNHRKGFRKPIIGFLILAGIALAIWGGYTVYKKTNKDDANITDVSANNGTSADTASKNTSQFTTDTTAKKDTIKPASTITASPATAGSFKFIIEKADSARAYNRYNRLQKFGWKVSIEKIDSASYKLFLLLPSSPADSSRVLDSLSRLTGKRVYIE